MRPLDLLDFAFPAPWLQVRAVGADDLKPMLREALALAEHGATSAALVRLCHPRHTVAPFNFHLRKAIRAAYRTFERQKEVRHSQLSRGGSSFFTHKAAKRAFHGSKKGQILGSFIRTRLITNATKSARTSGCPGIFS